MGRTHWPAVAVAIGVGIIGALHIGKLPSALPALKEEFGLTLVQAGWVVTTFNTLAMLAATLFGFASGRIGAPRFTLAGLVLMAAGGALGACAPTSTLLLAARFVEGAGFISVVIGAPALILAASAVADRKLALGLWSIYMPVGSSIGMLATPLALALTGWRGLWLAIAAMAMGAAVILGVMRSHYVHAAPGGTRPLRELVAPLRRPAPWWLALGLGASALQFTAVMVWLPTFLVSEGRSLAGAAFATVIFLVANIPGNLLGTWLLQRGATRGNLMRVSSLLMGLTAGAALIDALPVTLRFGAILIFSFFGGIVPAAILSAAQAHAHSPSEAGSLQGLLVQGSNVGQFIGPPGVAALVTASSHWSASLGVLLPAAALGVLAGYRVGVIEKRLHGGLR